MADELRAKIRGSIQRAIETAKKRAAEAKTVDTVNKANADMVGQAQALERRGFDDAAERGMIPVRDADQHRALNLTPPPGERQSNEQMRAQQAETERFGAEMFQRNAPHPGPNDEQIFRAQVPPSARGIDVPPSIAYSTDELGVPRANSSEDIQILESLLADAHDRELDRELSAPLPSPTPRAPAPSRAKDELGRPVPESKLISDEKAKTPADPRPYTGPLSPTVGGPIEGVSTARSGLAAGPMAPSAYMRQAAQMGHGREPSVTLGERFRPEVAEAGSKPAAPAKTGLAENDAADRRKRALDFMQFSASMPRFEMVDVGGRYRG